MATQHVDEVLGKALSSDSSVVPRFTIKDASGNVVAHNATIELDNPIVTAGTPVNKQVLDECLAASGVTSGSASAYTLSQASYSLFDGALVRFKLHTASGGNPTLNVNNTGAKKLMISQSVPMAAGIAAGTWIDAVYSSTLGVYIVTGSGGLLPQIIAYGASSSQTVTASNGTIATTFTYDSSLGAHVGYLPTFGSWTISGNGTSKSVVVDTVMQYYVVLGSLNDLSWNVIAQLGSSGLGASIFAIGDTKSVALSGTVGTLSLNTTLYAFIADFDIGDEVGIYFMGFKTAANNGVLVGLTDSHYNSTDASGVKWFNMNHWGNYNYGGWKGCDLRYDILGSTKTAPSGYGSAVTTSRVGYDAPSNTATSPVSNTLMAALPSALRAVMAPMTIYTDNKGNSSNIAANVTTSVDYLPLPAEFQIHGARTYANQYEQNYQKQLAYFANGNPKIFYRHSSTGSAAHEWCRSPSYDSANGFCIVTAGGSATGNNAHASRALAPLWRVAKAA